MSEGINSFCLDHRKHVEQIGKLEENVEKLWRKWDWIMILLVGNLATVIVLLVINIFSGINLK